jgi:tetratricopeptide (TPR) repeat protein
MASAQLEMSPGDGELHFLLAQSLHNDMLDLPHAMSEYNAAFAAGYDPYWVLVGRARLHRDLGSYRDAIRDYLHAALRRPLNRVTPRLLFHALRLSIRWRHSSADEPSPDRQATEAAWRLFHTGAFKESAAAAESLLETTPGNGELCLLLAQSLHNGVLDLPRALAAYDAALAGGCERYWALAGRARLHRHFGHRRQAIADVAAALANRPFGPVTTAIVITGSRVLGRRVRSLFGAPIGRAAE